MKITTEARIDSIENSVHTLGDQEHKLRESLLIFTCALMNFAVMLWLAIYWLMGAHFSTNIPLAYQVISISSLVYYFKTRHFAPFRFVQLSLFLFAPFIMQWSIGSSATSSGVMLWAMLAPLAAVGVAGWRESIPWFIAYLLLTALSGFFDYFLGMGEQGGMPTKTVGVFFALNFAAMSSILYFLVRYFVLETEKIKIQLSKNHALLAEEQKKSESLLSNMLPSHVARRLKNNEGRIADAHLDVAVLFAHMDNFNSLATKLLPAQLVDLLNIVFTGFDGIADKHGLEKIKTTGDGYMVVGGLTQEPREYTNHIATMALEMREFVANNAELSQYDLNVHIGIATGSVVAGVVGVKRFVYDLWGDTVNTAMILTDAATAGKILVDTKTYERLRRYYTFELPTPVSIKGKGEITAFRLTCKAE